MDNTKVIYEVKWKELARFFTRQLFVVIGSICAIALLIRFAMNGFSVAETFKSFPIVMLPLAVVLLFIACAVIAYLISIIFICARVTIENETISGRNYWLLKRTFKLEDIEVAFPFNSNGMPVVIVDAGKYGDIYVPIHINNSEELFSILDKYQKRKN